MYAVCYPLVREWLWVVSVVGRPEEKWAKAIKVPGDCNIYFEEQTRSPNDVWLNEENIRESTWRKNEKTGNVIRMSPVQRTRQRSRQQRWKNYINCTTLAEVEQLRRSKLNISIRNKNGYKDLDSLRYLMTVIPDEAQLKAQSQLHQN